MRSKLSCLTTKKNISSHGVTSKLGLSFLLFRLQVTFTKRAATRVTE